MRLSTGLTLALLVAACSTAGPRLVHQRFVLANGLRVYLMPDHRTPQVAVVTGYGVGSKEEVPGRTGFAHLFEHLMFEASPHAPDGMIDRILEAAGGWSNAWTSNDMTMYQDVAASNFLEAALWLEADRLAGLADALNQEHLNVQREVVRNERRASYENRPYGTAELQIEENLWPDGHPYHWPVIGSHEDLMAAKLPDVRSFFEQHYTPANATLVIAGDFDPAVVRPLVEKYFAWIPRGGTPPTVRSAPLTPLTKEIRLSATDQVEVPRVYVTWRGPTGYSVDEPPLALAAAVLAEGKSSRLYQRLVHRERTAQTVAADLEGRVLAGVFQIVVTAAPDRSADELLRVVDEEVARLAKDGPTDAELDRVKNLHEAAFVAGLDDLVDRAETLVVYDRVAGDPDYLARDLERYRRVTAAEVKQAAARWLGKGRVVLVVSPAPEQPEPTEDGGK